MRQATDDRSNGDRPITGRSVLLCLVAFFAVVTGVNAVMIVAAVSTFGGVETGSAYQAGLAFSREAAAVHAQDALHWDVKGAVRLAPGGEAQVEVSARDANGRPLAGITATAALQHPTDKRADHALTLDERTTGTFRGTTAAAAGQWDLVIELSRGGARMFRSKNRVVLH